MTVKGNLLIVGSGIAGLSAARAARRKYPHIAITLLSSEKDGFYNRIAVGALVAKKRTEAELFPIAAHLLESDRIDTRFGQTVTGISPSAKAVTLDNGQTLAFDRLILATGATPAPLPGLTVPAERIHQLWTIDDARSLGENMGKAKEIVVVGGGILGVEAALELCASGIRVHLVEAADRLLANQLSAPVSQRLSAALEARGVSVYLRQKVQHTQNAPSGLLVETADNRIRCDLMLVSVGVTPNTRLAQMAGITVDRGIVVNEYMETGVSGILACGNCIATPFGGARLWNPARAEGEIAGENAFVRSRRHQAAVHPIHLKSLDISLFSMGDAHHIPMDAKRLEESSSASFKEVYFTSDGHICHAAFWGDLRGYRQIEKQFRSTAPIDSARLETETISGLFTPDTENADPSGFLKPSWTCNVCGYTHEGEIAPGVCPVCSVGRDQFMAA